MKFFDDTSVFLIALLLGMVLGFIIAMDRLDDKIFSHCEHYDKFSLGTDNFYTCPVLIEDKKDKK